MSSEQAGRKQDSTGITELTRSVPSSPAARDLLNGVVRAAPSSADELSLLVFFRAQTVAESLRAWLGTDFSEDKDALIRRLNRDIATLDEMLSRQINAVLHAPAFQRLEAAWRGVHYLTEQANDPAIKVRVLSVTWRELERDFERSMEFDQSEMFRKIYEQEFGTPGGEPFGIVIADFEVHPTPTATHPHNDINVVRGLAQVGAAAFCPIILNASPALFGMDHFDGLQHRIDHASTFAQAAYLPWRTFRDSEHARFIGLTLPRILMRTPYADDGSRVDGFCFREDVEGTTGAKYLWGGAAFAFGEVALRAFSLSGWLADIRGFHRDEERGGLVTGLPVHCFATDKMGIALKSSTDVVISEELERQLSDLGFMPLCDCKDAEYSVFYSNPSAQKPKVYDREAATVNSRLSAMLQYMLCVSRFAHYIKVLGRDKTGAFSEATEFESYLQNWITHYVTADADASRDVKARHPLRGAQVQVYPVPGKPGSYGCTMHLSPHYELDDLNATIRLQAELTPRRV